jgi:hypothetical protein
MTTQTAAMLMNHRGELVPHTCQSTPEQVEEWCQDNLLSWDKTKAAGATIVAIEIRVVGEA